MKIERLIKEQIYLAKRRGRFKVARRSIGYGMDNKKVWGILCIVLGFLLIFTQCGKKDANKTNVKQQVTHNTTINEKSYSLYKEEEIGFEESYYTYLQDFEVGEKTLEQLYNLAIKNKRPYSDTLAIWTAENYMGTAANKILKLIKSSDAIGTLSHYSLYEKASQIYSQFVYDLVCFPLAKKESYVFENGWKQGRTYKGNRQHYGIDIMDTKNEPGSLKIFSMTDGVVENIGWNEVGGYRVGIRSHGGAYFYYAHLNELPGHLQKGDSVFAGDYLGNMGNTGYGKEGTKGVFPVHLHMGIAVKVKDQDEFWINPYYILRYLELREFNYSPV